MHLPFNLQWSQLWNESLHSRCACLLDFRYPIGLGRVGVRCRTHQEQLDGMSWPAAIKREAEWIETSGLKDKAGIRLGMPLLRQTLSELLIARVCKQLPLVIAQLDKRIKDAEHNQDFLKRLANEPNLRTVSKELESLVNQVCLAALVVCILWTNAPPRTSVFVVGILVLKIQLRACVCARVACLASCTQLQTLAQISRKSFGKPCTP